MTDNLRDRIAAVLMNAEYPAMSGYLDVDEPEILDDDRRIDGNINFALLADAVIAELGMKHYCRDCGGWGPMDD